MPAPFAPQFGPQFGFPEAGYTGPSPTQVRIANMALAKFGAIPIQSFDEASPAGSAVSLLYSEVVRGIFAEYPWNFAKLTVPLQLGAATPLSDGMLPAGWQFAYQLPPNLIGMPSRIIANNRYPDGPELRFEIQGDVVYSNQPALWAIGVYYVDEASWPAHFVSAVVACLAAELCMAISGAANNVLPGLELKAWGRPEDGRMGGKLGQAKLIDSRAQPSRVLGRNPLIDVRTATIGVIPTGATFP